MKTRTLFAPKLILESLSKCVALLFLSLCLTGCAGQSVASFMQDHASRIKIEEADMILTFMDRYYDKRTDGWTLYGNNSKQLAQIQQWMMPYPGLMDEELRLLLLEEPLEEFLEVFRHLASDLTQGTALASLNGSAYFEPLELIVLDASAGKNLEQAFWQEVGRHLYTRYEDTHDTQTLQRIMSQEKPLLPAGMMTIASSYTTVDYFAQLFGRYMTGDLTNSKATEVGLVSSLEVLANLKRMMY